MTPQLATVPEKTKDVKKFDLNIEKVLENWEIHHAIREIIANAAVPHLRFVQV